MEHFPSPFRTLGHRIYFSYSMGLTAGCQDQFIHLHVLIPFPHSYLDIGSTAEIDEVSLKPPLNKVTASIISRCFFKDSNKLRLKTMLSPSLIIGESGFWQDTLAFEDPQRSPLLTCFHTHFLPAVAEGSCLLEQAMLHLRIQVSIPSWRGSSVAVGWVSERGASL